MRRSLVLAFVAILAGCAHHLAPQPFPRASLGRPLELLVLGDSLGVGTGASSPKSGFAFRTYETLLQTHPGSRIRNVAVGGATAADVLRLQVPRVTGMHPDVTILVVGGNDVVRRIDPQRFAAAYTQTVAALHRALPQTKLVLVGVPDVSVSPLFAGIASRGLGALAERDNAVVRAIATREHDGFVDLFGLSQRLRRDPGRDFSQDQFHPSDAGYAIIAQETVSAIAGLLGASR